MTPKAKLLICMGAFAVAFATGRYSAPTKTITKVETVEVEKKTKQVDSDSSTNRHKETTETEVTRPDGTKETTRKTVEDTSRDKKTSESATDVATRTEVSSKEVIRDSGRVNISVLGGLNVGSPTSNPALGGSIIKNILGPITVGAFGLNSGVVGVSLGLNL